MVQNQNWRRAEIGFDVSLPWLPSDEIESSRVSEEALALLSAAKALKRRRVKVCNSVVLYEKMS